MKNYFYSHRGSAGAKRMNIFWYLEVVMDQLNYGILEQPTSLRSAVLKSTTTKSMLLIGIYKCVTATLDIITHALLIMRINCYYLSQTKDNFVSGSWDDSIRVWSPLKPRSMQTYREHRWVFIIKYVVARWVLICACYRYCVYSTVYSPHFPTLFASASGDHTLKVWDLRGMCRTWATLRGVLTPVFRVEQQSVLTIKAHNFEILTCDWNKYNENILVSGSVDKSIKIWDIRQPTREIRTLYGHRYAVRRLKCSPHHENIVASCSYDMSMMVWDIAAEEALIDRYEHHTEFVVGLDWNIFIDGQVASCGWDQTVYCWVLGQDPARVR